MGYKEKLVQFNKTANYNNEMRFMMGLIEPDENEIIIDYGCGTGYMMERIKELSGVQCFGYDVTDYSIHSVDNMLNALPDSIDKVYFMHSFAHIPNPVHTYLTPLMCYGIYSTAWKKGGGFML
jgi:ubiquinone/menaquinone biosynthesis C-methylase UbiE